ncbi:hypothetical protein [Streptomyces sp. NPDC003015]
MLRELGTLEQTEPREGDEAARDELTRRVGSYVQQDVDAWLAHALAAHLGHYRDPAAREAAADLLPTHLLATPRCSPNSRTSRRAPASASWRSRPGSPLPTPRPLASSPRSSPVPGLGRADLIGLTVAADIG